MTVTYTVTVDNTTADNEEKRLPKPGDKVTVGADVALDFSDETGAANTATVATSPLTITRSASVRPPA